MRNQASWSLSLGRWGGVHVRLHMFFFLLAALVVYLVSVAPDAQNIPVWLAPAAMLILLASVVLHEMGHLYAALRLGGRIDQIVLGPLGGLGTVKPPPDLRGEMFVHLAGPLVNLGLASGCAAVLLMQNEVSLLKLLHPLAPTGLIAAASTPVWIIAVKLALWINWVLLLVNLIPAFPLDAGRALHAGLALLWPATARRRVAMATTHAAQILALGLIIAAWFVRGIATESLVPMWFPLVVLAIFLFFTAPQQETRDVEPSEELFGYDFSQGYTSLERSSQTSEAPPQASTSAIAQWLDRRKQARQQRMQEIEVEEERRVDDILARLHEGGIKSLSTEDRALLERVSARYRNRSGNNA